jgi:cell pole-organizing protein PopZ
MNAPNPLSGDKRNAERKAYEPSMEEILASIRRIIADDQAFAQRRGPPPRPLTDPPLAATRASAQEIAPNAAPAEAQFPFFKTAAVPPAGAARPGEAARLEQADRRELSTDEPWLPAPPPGRPVSEESGGADLPLVSPRTDACVSSSFNALVAGRFQQSGEGDLDEIVREMLRPMLKAWLDDNLPVLVERLVRAEIERVARGGTR